MIPQLSVVFALRGPVPHSRLPRGAEASRNSVSSTMPCIAVHSSLSVNHTLCLDQDMVVLFALIHPSAWKVNAANFACTEPSEVCSGRKHQEGVRSHPFLRPKNSRTGRSKPATDTTMNTTWRT